MFHKKHYTLDETLFPPLLRTLIIDSIAKSNTTINNLITVSTKLAPLIIACCSGMTIPPVLGSTVKGEINKQTHARKDIIEITNHFLTEVFIIEFLEVIVIYINITNSPPT